MIEIANTKTDGLVRGHVSYSFLVVEGKEDVKVRRSWGRLADNYTLPRDEARELYASLKRQGYTRF